MVCQETIRVFIWTRQISGRAFAFSARINVLFCRIDSYSPLFPFFLSLGNSKELFAPTHPGSVVGITLPSPNAFLPLRLFPRFQVAPLFAKHFFAAFRTSSSDSLLICHSQSSKNNIHLRTPRFPLSNPSI